jgi:trigger factor
MKFNVEEISSVKKVLHIEVPAAEVSRELGKAYQELKKTSKIKGFRPGKAPRSVLERMYAKEVNADVSSRLIQSAFVEALKESELKVVGNPKIDPPALKDAADYRFDATVDVKPEIDDIDFKGFKLKKNLYQPNDEEIEAQLKMLQRNLADRKPITEARPAQEGDVVLIDYEGFQNGAPHPETEKTENFIAKIGEARLHKDFDRQLIGMSAGEEKTFDVTFADDYFNAKLAGETISFQVSLQEIREELLPEIDDEMAAKVGPYKTLEELKKAIRDNLDQGYRKRGEQELNEQIFQALIAKTAFELPDTLVEYELESIINEAERSFANQNMTLDQVGLSRESLAEKYRETAEKQVRRYLLLGKIIEQEKVEISDADMDAAFEEMAATYQQPVDALKAFYSQQPEKLEGFRHAQLEKRAVRLIIDHSEIEEVTPEPESKGAEG